MQATKELKSKTPLHARIARHTHQYLAVALGDLATVSAQLEEAREELQEAEQMRVMIFEGLHASIEGGRVPEADVPDLVAAVPGFAQWREQKRAATGAPHPSDTTAVANDHS